MGGYGGIFHCAYFCYIQKKVAYQDKFQTLMSHLIDDFLVGDKKWV